MNDKKGRNFESLRKQYHDLIQSYGIGDDDARKKAADCRELIFHIHNRIEYAESRRSQVAAIALALLAGAIALFLTSVSDKLQAENWTLILRIAALALFTTSVATLVLYARQINFSYPFIGVTKTWRWFYHYSVSKEYKPPFHSYEGDERRKKMQELHLTNMVEYAKNTLKLTAKDELEQDLEQLFLMIVNEKYKNAQLSHLRTVIFIGLLLTVLILIVAGIILTM